MVGEAGTSGCDSEHRGVEKRLCGQLLGRTSVGQIDEGLCSLCMLASIEQALNRQDASLTLTADAGQIAGALQRLVRQDYARDQVVSVAGWVLSVTEARLYALVAMTA